MENDDVTQLPKNAKNSGDAGSMILSLILLEEGHGWHTW